MGQARSVAALVCSLLLVVARAEAQPVPSLNLRQLEPPTGPDGSFYLESTATPAAGEWNVGAWLSYGRSLVVIENAEGDRIAVPLRSQLSLDYLASAGLGRGLALGVALPTVLYQTGDDLGEILDADPLPRTAIGDATVDLKASLLAERDGGGLGLGVLARVTAPTGDPRSYVGEGTTTGQLRLLADADLLALSLRATAGIHLRAAERTYVQETFGHALPWGIGVTFMPRVLGVDDAGTWEWLVDFHGAVSLAPEIATRATSPALSSFGARYHYEHLAFIAGGEVPLGAAVGVPAWRALAGVGWAPRFYDRDSDGIEDDDDECPEFAEDPDGFEDRDGCPDFDDDYDGVKDDSDQCPKTLEDKDGYQDEDGCPDPDNDGDGIADEVDACPKEAGSEDSHARGCPPRDTDRDGVFDHRDRCPKQAEDRDDFQDDDGCPDPDNDRDRIRDEADACPNSPGPTRSDPKLNGCPSPDRDGDSFDDPDDKCPDESEDFDGQADDDGCPDADEAAPEQGPLLSVERQGEEWSIGWRSAPRLVSTDGAVAVDPASLPTVRALAQTLNAHPGWVLLVGVRPRGPQSEAAQAALTEAFALVQTLRRLTHRDDVAESVGWTAVADRPGARASGIGVRILERPQPRRPQRPK